jgi:hypothetical protein
MTQYRLAYVYWSQDQPVASAFVHNKHVLYTVRMERVGIAETFVGICETTRSGSSEIWSELDSFT